MAMRDIETTHLVLRRSQLADADRITDLICDWNVIRNLALPPFSYQRADARAFSQRAVTWQERSGGGDYVITRALETAAV
ncbi:MAG: hypothetical protein KKB37_13620 [Alphaproteobacteria bacterium]|nr:hypothetical protein [Alphaproteobacteria bacterium]